MLVAVITLSAASYAQGRRGLRINEVMVQNDSNYVDDYGLHHAWIELFKFGGPYLEPTELYQ